MDIHSLILAHFDRALDSRETTELSKLIANDPLAARTFAQLARQDYAMERHFGAASKAKQLARAANFIQPLHQPEVPAKVIHFPDLRRTAKWGVAAAFLLLACVIGISIEKDTGTTAHADNRWREAAIPYIAAPRVPGVRPVAFIDGLSPEEKRAAAELRARLNGYFLPSIDIREKRLEDALGVLDSAMRRHDHDGWVENRGMRFTSESMETERSVRLVRENLSTLEALELLAIQSGSQLHFHPEGVVFEPFETDSNSTLLTRVFPLKQGTTLMIGDADAPESDWEIQNPYVNPIGLNIAPAVLEFDGFINLGAPRTTIGTGDGELTIEEVSFRDPQEAGVHYIEFSSDDDRNHLDPGENELFATIRANPAKELLEQWGIRLSEGGHAEWKEEDGGKGRSLQVTATRDNLDRIDTIMRTLDNSNGRTIEISTRILELPSDAVPGDWRIEATEVADFIAETSDASVTAYPTVITRNGMSAAIQSVVNVPVNQTVVDYQGLSLGFKPTLEGSWVSLSGTADIGFTPDKPSEMPENTRKLHPESPIVHLDATFSARMGPHHASIFTIPGAAGNGKSLVLIVEARRP